VLHDNPDGRLRWMDAHGIDVQLVLPGGVTAASTALDLGTSVGLLESFNRYLTGYCEPDPERMKAAIQVHGGAPTWSAEEIRRYGGERSVAAFSVCLPEELAIDDPSLEPIWQASGELELPLLHHAFPGGTPRSPGYLRAAAHQLSAQRLLGALVQAGHFERHPALSVILAESGAGWMPAWLQRVGGLEYARAGRILAALDPAEDETIAESVISLVGEDALVCQSGFPTGGVDGSPADPLCWERVGERVRDKILAGNAERCLRLL
jgi:predicted TIM-barrel fold metal-dependent hydrolase